MKLIKSKCLKYVCLSLVLFAQAKGVSAGEEVYFQTSDGVKFWCNQGNLNYNLDHENGKLAAICSVLAEPGKADGLSEETAFKLDVNGKIFKKYILDFFRYGKVAFKNKIDAENTLNICEDLGLPLAEKYICSQVLDRSPRQFHIGSAARDIVKSLETLAELDENVGSFVKIEGGNFQMGSPLGEQTRRVDEIQHWVTLSDFELGETGVTQEIYASIMGTNPSTFKEQKYCPGKIKMVESHGGAQVQVCANYPVEQVSWNDAIQFINIVNDKFKDFGYRFSLPTEAQLEYAFRGGTDTAFVSGADEAEDLGEYIWHSGNSGKQSQSVKSKRANAYGIYRSSVQEWANDWYAPYPEGEATDPRGPLSGCWSRVLRGGGWDRGASDSRSACRAHTSPNTNDSNLGFRLRRTRISESN
ncbi:MAG: formylglycine-generating enzyme family protein [Bdellovibrionia bacterium]